MGAREPESCLQISGERRMALTIVVIIADSSEATQDIITDIKKKWSILLKNLEIRLKNYLYQINHVNCKEEHKCKML